MNKTKLALVLVATVVLGWLTSFANSFTSVQCTEVAMLTTRDPMGPIWYYKQMASFCQFGNTLIVLAGIFFIGLIWYQSYKTSIKKFIEENL